MKNTRFMERLFSAMEENDEELLNQVAKDIEDAKANGKVEDEEVIYESTPDGNVSVTDKENGEVTNIEGDAENGYDMGPAEMSQQIEGYLHPAEDGVTPGEQQGAPDEHVENHPELENGVTESNPTERSAEEEAVAGPEGEVVEEEEGEEEQVEFSVSTDNIVVQRIFSDQVFCERLFSEVIESEETAVVGDLKVEKVPGEEAVVVTSKETGDQAKVSLDESEMEVEELESKNFCGECGCEEGDCECGVDNEVELGGQQYLPLHVVGLDAFNHQIVDAVEYCPESAQELVNNLTEAGVEGVQVFENMDAARDYALQLLEGLGAEEIAEPEQVEFSNNEEVYVTRFFSSNTNFMIKLFSEAVGECDASQSAIEDAINNGDEIETDSEIITPVDANTAVVEDKDNGEYTKVTLEDEEMHCDPITEGEAEDLMDNLEVEAEGVDEDEEEEREYSSIWTNEAEDRFFSDHEEMTQYMQRLFSEEADSKEIEDAIESGEEIENDTEVITPVDAKTAVVEDKETGEFTKAVMDDEKLDVTAISEEEADDLMSDLAVGEERGYSDVWTNEAETRFFSENEVMTQYMQRLFSEEADQDEIESAIESGEQIENDTEVITPVDAKTAVIEDKETGEFTKAEIVDDEDMNVEAISEEEADELTDGVVVEDNDEEGEENGEEASKDEDEKQFSDTLTKFFNDIQPQEGNVAPQGQVANNGEVEPSEEKPSIEQVEDKAAAAIQAIQEMTEQAQMAIQEAKEAPVEGQEEDLREATFSDNNNVIDSNPALNWLTANMK